MIFGILLSRLHEGAILVMVSDPEKPYYSTGPWTVGYEFIINNLSFLSLGICLQIKPTNSFAVSFLRKHFVIRECNLMDTHAYIHYTTAVLTIYTYSLNIVLMHQRKILLP